MFQQQTASSSSAQTTHQLTPYIKFRPSSPDDPQSRPPLCLLFSWMLAQDAHIEKFRQFWTRHGYDILTIETPYRELFLPGTSSVSNAQEVLKFLAQNAAQNRPIICHSFSIGTIATFTFLDQLNKALTESDNPNAALHIQRSLCGLILDSPNYPQFLPTGNARMLTGNRVVQWLIELLFRFYYTLTAPFTKNRFARIEALQLQNRPFALPGLILYSENDILMPGYFSDHLVESWTKRGISVRAKRWPVSDHVMHYRNFPNEYSEAVEKFLVEDLRLPFRK